MIFHELINNITLLLTIILFFSLVIEKCPVESRRQYVFYGLIFGIASIIGMQNSFIFSDGVVYDARSVILSIAGLLGGPVAASISAFIAGSYRFVMGGPGVLAGVGTILTSSLLGVLFYYLSRRYEKLLGAVSLYFFGVLVNGAVLLWMFTLPEEMILKVIETVGVPLMILFPLATVLVGTILLHQKRAILARRIAALNEQRFKLAMEATSDGIWDYDLVTDRVFYSKTWKKMLGYEEDEIGDSLEEWLSRLYEEDRDRADALRVRYTAQPDGIYENIFRMYHKDGSLIWILSRGGVIVGPTGKALRFVGTHTNITAQKRAEKQLRDLNENLQDMVRKEVEKNRKKDQLLIHQSKLASLGEMLGAIAHHWRQPLTAVSLNIQNIHDLYEYGELTKKELEQSVTDSMTLIQKMSHTIDEFRRFFDPGTTKEFFSLTAALSDIRELIGPELDEKHIVLKMDLEEDIRIHGYQNRFKQTLLNLISNAKDAVVSLRHKGAMPPEAEGMIRIAVYRDGKDVVTEVTDNGGGIGTDLMERIFTPYFSTKEQGEGVGIGLYMSRVIIEKYFKGSIAVENSAGGLKATIRLNPEPDAA